jgi:hypothetical protein
MVDNFHGDYHPDAFDYIRHHSGEITRVSRIMSVDPLAVAGSIAEEISDKRDPNPLVQLKEWGGMYMPTCLPIT